MSTAWIILVVIILILLWLGFREADREYMRCLCGRQPVCEKEEYTGGFRYHCKNCGIVSAEGRTEIDAKELWHNLIKYHKKHPIKKGCKTCLHEDCCSGFECGPAYKNWKSAE